jgi:chromosome segregation ATPase
LFVSKAKTENYADRIKALEAENAQLRQERDEARKEVEHWKQEEFKTHALIPMEDFHRFKTMTEELSAALKRAEEAEKLLEAYKYSAEEIDKMTQKIIDFDKENAALRQQLEEARKHNESEDKDIIADVLRMENKKLGGVLSEICKLIKSAKPEEKYFDEADVAALRSKLSTLEAELARGRKGGTYSGHL